MNDNEDAPDFENDVDFEVPVQKHKGLVLAPDDVTLGDWIAVYKVKENDTPQPIYGQAIKVTAIQLPFILGKLAVEPRHPPVTLDVRFLDLMRVNEEYAKAQSEGASKTPEQDAMVAFKTMMGR
jgi:hypothetical protein